MKPELIIVGTGAAATALAARAVHQNVQVACVIGRELQAARVLANLCGASVGAVEDLAPFLGSEMVLLAVPDRALPAVSAHLAALWPGGRQGGVAHLSGVLTAIEGLGALKDLGIPVLSWHPAKALVRTFDPAQLDDAFVCVEAPAAHGIELGVMLAHAMGVRPLSVEARHKPLYHAALSVGSNFTVVLAALMEQMLLDAGIEGETARALGKSLLASTLQNLLALTPAEALTGPIVRGDRATVTAHLKHLPREFVALYREMGIQAVHLGHTSGRLAPDLATGLLETLKETRT